MAPSTSSALLLWTKENKTGIEPLKNLPPNGRFEGSVTPAKFSGNNRWFPCRVIKISDNLADLEARQVELEAELLNSTEAVGCKRLRKRAAKAGKASARDVAKATGSRPPAPEPLQAEHLKDVAARKACKASKSKAQLAADADLLQGQNVDMDIGSDTDMNKDDDSGNHTDDDGHDGPDSSDSGWCGCKACTVLQKYDSPLYLNFLRDVSELFCPTEPSVRYLELLQIPFDVQEAELAAGTGVCLAATVKDQLKVDFRNKPTALARETLFALYGREAFSVLSVSGRGKKRGAYTIPPQVIQAVCLFVNKNVEKSKRIKQANLVALINKRAPEWRRDFKKAKISKAPVPTSPVITPVTDENVAPPERMEVGTPLRGGGNNIFMDAPVQQPEPQSQSQHHCTPSVSQREGQWMWGSTPASGFSYSHDSSYSYYNL